MQCKVVQPVCVIFCLHGALLLDEGSIAAGQLAKQRKQAVLSRPEEASSSASQSAESAQRARRAAVDAFQRRFSAVSHVRSQASQVK